MQFDYFYPEQADQYAFYRIPRRLFTDNNFKELTAEAKILYGLMLDRVSLSLKNMWIDKSRRVYIIFTLKEVMDTLNCGDKKATRLMGELEKCGLIERDRRGLGKPNLIYVKNFNSGVPPNERFQTRQNYDSGVGNMETQGSSEQRGTNTNKNYIDESNTNPILNQKGGTGKTTTCENLGVGLAKEGKKVLLVDTDPQASLTISLGYPRPDDLEVSLVNSMSRETILKQYLDTVKNQYDYVLLDCMPSLGMLTVNALAASDNVIIPVQAQYLSAKGLEQLLQTINKVRRQINPKLKIEGILLTMVDSRTNYAKDISTLIRDTYGTKLKVYKTDIPRSVRAEEISAEGKSIFEHDPKGKVADAYRVLTKEVLENAEKKRKRQLNQLR